MHDDLLAGLDDGEVATIRAAIERANEADGVARACRAQHRMQLRRANSEAHLTEILPPTFAPGDSWHVISRGDVDSLSFLAHAIRGAGFFDVVYLSTWCMARADLDQLAAWLDDGAIERLHLFVGEIFPSQYGDEFERARELVRIYGADTVRLVVARNHSKVMLASRTDAPPAGDLHLVFESSANVNTNPRIEQTAVHHSRELFDFYRDFFDDLRSIDRQPAG